MVKRPLRRSGFSKIVLVPILLTALTAIMLTIMVLTTTTNNLTPYSFQRSVDIWVENNNVYVNVSVSLPGAVYYYYYGVYYYYYYYQGIYYAVPSIKVMVSLERFTGNTPSMIRFSFLELSLTNPKGQVVFHNLVSGSYRVKVLFWNDFLTLLSSRSEGWIPMAYPVFKNVTIT